MDETTDLGVEVPTHDLSSWESTDMGDDVSTDMGGEVAEDTDAQIESIVESLDEVEGLHPEYWEQLDASERVSVLQDVEERIAETQGRPAVAIDVESTAPGVYGGYVSGWGIVLSESHLQSEDVHEVLETVAHESRHAYQDYVVRNPGTLSDTELVEAWRDNWNNYLTVEEYGQELYISQPLEADAWEYGAKIADMVFGIQR
jgi:hypothetical protein